MEEILKISIVTPSFNQAAFIEETLRSVESQKYPNLEHIVVDGGSTDATINILKRYSAMPGWEHLRWISERDRGQTDALNKGFRCATGDIIGWLNSDDLYQPGCLAAISTAFLAHDHADFIYGDYIIIDDKGKVLISKKEIDFDWDIMLCGLNYIAQPNVFFRRRVLDRVGYLNESLHYIMDYEFWLRAASNGLTFQRIPSILAACRWHLNAKTVSLTARAHHEIATVREKYWNRKRFSNPSLQTMYQKYCNCRARASRQWRKLQTRSVVDVIPVSLYLRIWRARQLQIT